MPKFPENVTETQQENDIPLFVPSTPPPLAPHIGIQSLDLTDLPNLTNLTDLNANLNLNTNLVNLHLNLNLDANGFLTNTNLINPNPNLVNPIPHYIQYIGGIAPPPQNYSNIGSNK